jgi:phage shock protein PspC (stress-responsive transcriptional regulator)
MKKTVTINLNSIIFHIDEDAHEMLLGYLNSIKSKFNLSDGRDEIMTDIEARISEMFQAEIKGSKQVISIEEVEKVIAIMGKPEDYLDEDNTEPNKNPNTQEEDLSYKRKRVFRDPDNRVFSGVCGGIGAYFNFDPIILRILFAIAFFVFGTGFLIYLLLWVIIPKAKTTAEKLEMRGEKVNVSNIERSIREEMDNIKKTYNDITGSTGSSSESKKKTKNPLNKLVDFLVSLFSSSLKAIGKLLAVILIVIGLFLLITILGSLFGSVTLLMGPLASNQLSWVELGNIFLVSSQQLTMVSIGFLLLLGIPVLAITYLGIKLLLGIKGRQKSLGTLALIIWLAGFLVLGYTGNQIANDFGTKGVTEQNINLGKANMGNLYLEVIGEDHQEDNYDSQINLGSWHCYFNDQEMVTFGSTQLDIAESLTDSFELVVINTAFGNSKKEAMNRSAKINYAFSQKDSLIQLDPYFNIPRGEKWRNQNVKMTLKIPVGSKVFLDNSMGRIIYDIANIEGIHDMDMLEETWIMTERGLECHSCKTNS